MYEILNEIEKYVPKKLSEINAKTFKPAYRFVTSENFLIGTTTIAILLALFLIGSKVIFV